MSSPEEALELARRRAADRRPADAATDHSAPFPAEEEEDWRKRLAQWATIEPDESEVYSTRALGAPVTWVKKLLLRLLRQYLDQMTAQQSRFNAHVLGHLIALQDRVTRLEEAAGVQPEPQGEDRPDPGPPTGP